MRKNPNNFDIPIFKFSFLHKFWLHFFHQGSAEHLPIDIASILHNQQNFPDRPKMPKSATVMDILSTFKHNFLELFCDKTLLAQK